MQPRVIQVCMVRFRPPDAPLCLLLQLDSLTLPPSLPRPFSAARRGQRSYQTPRPFPLPQRHRHSLPAHRSLLLRRSASVELQWRSCRPCLRRETLHSALGEVRLGGVA